MSNSKKVKPARPTRCMCYKKDGVIYSVSPADLLDGRTGRQVGQEPIYDSYEALVHAKLGTSRGKAK